MNPEVYINNYRYLLKKETENNDIINRKLQNRNIKNSNKLLNKKMVSDKLIIKYKNEIIKATNIYTKYQEGIIISTCAIINNEKEIIFIKEGYDKNFEEYKSMPILKWEIIKKYINLGYTKFDLGYIKEVNGKKYTTNQGFNGNIIECSNEFHLVINDMLYKLNNSINTITKNKN
jgi:lipid II:glycine glycyltransferase (peptidoglycan interpeptide bridge formation enzyme)